MNAIICDVCGSDMIPGSAWFARCPACKFQVSNLQPGAGSGIDGLVTLRIINAHRLLDHLIGLGLQKGAKILEIGCSTGEFIEIAGTQGFDATGIEPDAEAYAIAAAKGLRVHNGFFPDDVPSDIAYDVLVFNHSFEHIPNPGNLVRSLAAYLQPDGRVVIHFPSSGGVLFRLISILYRFGIHSPLERFWQKGFVSPHVTYFDTRNLQTLVEKNAPLRLESTRHMLSVCSDGMYGRVRSSFALLPAIFITAILYVFVLLAPVLPSDFEALVFRIRSD